MLADVGFGFLDELELVLDGHLQILQMLRVPRTDLAEQLPLQVVVVPVDLVYGLSPVFLQDVGVVLQHVLRLVLLSLHSATATSDFSSCASPEHAV